MLTTTLLIIHLVVTLALIGVVLIQRSEGGGLGIGTSQGMGGFMSGRGTANLLTRTTAILGTIFFVISLTLAYLDRGANNGHSILNDPPPAPPAAPASGPALSGAPPATTTPGPATTPDVPGTRPLPESPLSPPAPRGPAVPTN